MRTRFNDVVLLLLVVFLSTQLSATEIGDLEKADPMILEYDTSLSVGNSVTLPLKGNVDVTIDWGDGYIENFNSEGYKTHQYEREGIYNVTISGSLYGFGAKFERNTNIMKLTKIISFGDIGLVDLSQGCMGAHFLTEVPKQIPESVRDLSYLFSLCYRFNQDIGSWEVSKIQNFEGMFKEANSFNHNINSWNVSSATIMNSMFFNATSFNQPLDSWNLSRVTSTINMFSGASSFNQDIGSWDVSRVRNMSGMFFRASSFNQDISSWDISDVDDMGFMFYSSSFDQDISGWNVENVTKMDGMFGFLSLFNQDISSWDVSNVTTMRGMFEGAASFNQNIGSWDVSNVTDMSFMFKNATSFNQDLNSWDVSKVTNMNVMFKDASSLNQSFSQWDISKIETILFFLSGTNISTKNYDATLIGWANNSNTPSSKLFHGGYNKYSSASLSARSYLKFEKNWNIYDGGFSGIITEDILWDGGLIEIEGDIVVETGSTLTITPGTTIKFNGPYSIDVKGRVVAEGSFEEKIRFESDHHQGWRGISFNDNEEDSSIFEKCIFTDVNDAPVFEVGNSAGTDGATIIIVDIVIEENENDESGAIFVYNGDIELSNSLIVNNVVGENGAAIYLENSSSKIINCTIGDNSAGKAGGGIAFVNSDAVVYNSVIWNNRVKEIPNQINIEGYAVSPSFYNSNIEGGLGDFTGSGSGANFMGKYENNINLDPEFYQRKGGENYTIGENSPCVNGGTLNIDRYLIPQFDIIGNKRIYSGSIDMGAYEYNPEFADDQSIVENYRLYQNYPNPFNPTTTISFNIPYSNSENLQLSIYNINGEIVESMELSHLNQGLNSVELNMSNYSSGVFFYKLEGREISEMRRMVLCK